LWVSVLAGLACVVVFGVLAVSSYLSDFIAKDVIAGHLGTMFILATVVFVAGFAIALRWTGLMAIQSGMRRN
jgi:predicted anti-sigma-YlaC factor YlaD